jgi:hypothetical protein
MAIEWSSLRYLPRDHAASGASQCPAAQRLEYAGSTTTTARLVLAVICTSRSLNRAVGMPATSRRNRRPRLPREGLFPVFSRPSARASAKPGSSMTTARAPWSRAVAIRADTAARTRPSRWEAGSPASSRGMVSSVPVMLPSGARTAAARWPAFTSTATTGEAWSSSSGGTGRGWVVHDASACQRSRAGSQDRS